MTEAARLECVASEDPELLRLALETIDHGLLMIGPDERIRVFNKRARDLLGVPANMLFAGAHYGDIRRYLFGDGRLRDPADPEKAAVPVDLERGPATRTRLHADGTVVEVKAWPLPDGGVVRVYADVTDKLTDERSLRESEQRFRLLAENTKDVVILSDLDTTRRYVSPAAKSVLGYDPDELVGTKPLDFIHPDDVQDYGRLFDDLCSGKLETAVTTRRYRRKDGEYVWIEVSFSLTHDNPGGPPTGFISSLRDASDRRRVEDELRISRERLALALDSGDDGIWDWDVVNGAVTFFGKWHARMGFDIAAGHAPIERWIEVVHPDDRSFVSEALAAHHKGRSATFECEYRVRSKASSEFRWTLTRGKAVEWSAAGRATRVVGTHMDINRRKEAEALVVHMASHDALTGLPNRALFQQRLDQAIADYERRASVFAVLACDLDRFKEVNDTFGHRAGDDVLRVIGSRLQKIVCEFDTVARIGGDEFAIILHCRDGRGDDAAIAAGNVIAALQQPIDIGGHMVGVGVSIGVATSSTDGAFPHLYKNADTALYRAKAEGRDAYCFYEAGMDAGVADRILLENELREAAKHPQNAFELHYQPIVDLGTDRVCGFEALLRWRHPTRGVIAPSAFIPISEATGAIVPIGDWALNEACRQANLWPNDLRMAVNVSAVQFRRPHHLQQTVLQALCESGLAPCRLELEITESVLLQDTEAVIACLHVLRELGVSIALDDFGTGYSSLAYLRRFPFGKIKIDRSFVREIADPGTAAIVSAVVGLGKRAGADITAEGVETVVQCNLVRSAGCTQMQGFLFSRPLTVAQASALLMERNRSAA